MQIRTCDLNSDCYFTFSKVAEPEYCDEHMYVCVSLYPRAYRWYYSLIYTVLVCATFGHGSILLRQCRDMSCTSSSMEDVMFEHYDQE